jgi:SLOG in TRPM, prokaryote/SMODS and SLOG-associating 2TM effector domain 1/Protein of unknown function (DUF4231)
MIQFVNAASGLIPGQPAEIRFGNGNQAAAYLATGGAGEAVSRLGLASGDQKRPVLLVCGGANDLADPELARASQLLVPAITTAAKVTRAVVADGGTAAGVMQLAGLARTQHRAAIPVLIGIAPAGKITYPGGPEGVGLAGLQEDHSHFILADSAEWGGETALMMATAGALARGAPVVMVLAGGGKVATAEVLAAARQRWPVFVVTGTGGLADRLAQLWNTHRVPRRRPLAILLPKDRKHRPVPSPADIDEPSLREIITAGDLHLVTSTDPAQFSRQLAWELQDESVLKQAWQRFATYDGLAGRLRKTFTRVQGTILTLGVVATLLALIHNQTGGAVLHWAVVAAPILVSVLIALASRNATGQRWVVLRAAAETIKSEIYRYRTGSEAYGVTAPGTQQLTSEETLAARLRAIDAKLMQTQASSGILTPYDGPLPPPMYGAASDDDGLSPLDAQRYLRIRASDQLGYYHGKIRTLSRRRNAFQFLAIVSGGVGAIIAAAGEEVWVGLTSGIAAAALAYLGYLQVDNTIVSYNQAASALQNLRADWDARSTGHRTPEAFHKLVTSSESVLTTELSGWVQQMNDALRELAARQAEDAKQQQDEAGAPATPASGPRAGARG